MAKSELTKLRDKLDTVFSQFIRLRDSNNEGIAICISCGTPGFWKYGDCGHYISRKYLALRWEEKNVGFQDKECNIFGQGEQVKFQKGLIKRYGPDVIEYLETKKHNRFNADRFVYQYLIDEYKAKLKALPNYHLLKERS